MNDWTADPDRDALNPFRPRDDDWTPGSTREHLTFYALVAPGCLLWAGLVVALIKLVTR